MPSFENEISEAHRGTYAGFGYPGTVRLTDKERMALVSKNLETFSSIWS